MTPTGAAGASESLAGPLLSAEGIIFLVLALGIVGMSIFCMTRKNPVTAVMSLVATFFGLSAMYATLSAHFLAVLQILVYAGAIMVLFIFVVMILNREESTAVSLRGLPTRLLGVGAGLYLMWVFVRVATPDQLVIPPPVGDAFGTVASVGDILFRQFLFPFEAISVLLLVAIVGGVVVSRSAQKELDAVAAAERRGVISDLSSHDSPEAGAQADAADSAAGVGHVVGGGHH